MVDYFAERRKEAEMVVAEPGCAADLLHTSWRRLIGDARHAGRLSTGILARLAIVSRWRRRLAGDLSGAGAIEFAIVAPLFLLIVLGLLVYGIYLGSVHSVEQLAADAARASVAGLSDSERIQIATQHISTNAPDYPLIDASKISIAAGPSAADPTQFRVSVRFDASNLPIWGLSAFVPMPERVIERTSVIKRGGF
jgi:Flp pilus assembly protein TadG